MIGIIIQARMNSSRLPGKILMKIGNKTLLEHILFRISFLKKTAKLVIATTNTTADDVVEEFCKNKNVSCFRGDEQNVLERYYRSAEKYKFQHIIRLTSDNPFVDIEELDNLIELHIGGGSDFSYSFNTLPIGVGAEIFSFSALETCWHKSTKSHHFEHVDEYILENLSLFKTSSLKVPDSKNKLEIRLTVDTPDDYAKACFIVKNCKNEYITTPEAIELCMQYV